MATGNNDIVKQLILSVYKGQLTVQGTGANITVKVDDRGAVKDALYKQLTKKKVPYKDEKSTKSSFNITKIKTPDGKEITIIWKNAAGGGGSGAGAAATELGESAQCWYTAVAFHGTLKNQDDFLKQYAKIAAKCKTDAPIDKIVKMLGDDWIESSIKIANYMKGMPEFKSKMKTYSFHRGGPVVDKISAMFLAANRKENMFANINKWTPADIWLFTPAGEREIVSADKDQTFATLNKLIAKLYKSGDAIGVSLKKVGTNAHHEVFNYDKSGGASLFKSFKISDKSKDGYLLFSYKDDANMSMQLRSFSDTGSWQGEIKGKYASGGKIGGGQIAAIFNRVAGVRLAASDAKTITAGAQARHKKIMDGIKKFAKDLKIKVVAPEDQSNDWVYSKYLALETFAAFAKLDKKKQEHILNEIVGYASSSTENSAVFIKIS